MGADPSNDPRRLGLGSAVALVVANMVGAGVFTTSGFALGDLGDRRLVLLAWVVGGALALCGALCYGALARRIPESGGEYTFLSATLHPLAGFLAGWVSLLAGFTAPIAAAALGLQAYLAGAPSVGDAEPGAAWDPEWIGTAAVASAALMHGLRVREGVWLQNAAVLLKLVVIAGFVALGLAALPPAAQTASTESAGAELGAFAVTLVWISFSYSGWNAAVYVAGEVREPERNLERSLWIATGLVTVAYLGLNTVFLYAAPADALAGRAEVGAIAAQALGGPVWRQAASWLVALALFTSISSMVMAGPRVYARMAQDGLFPRVFKAGSAAPGAAVALQAVLAIAVVWSTGLAQLLSYIGFTLGLSAALTVVGLMRIRQREGGERVPVPGYPWIPIVFIGVTLATAAFVAARRPEEALWGLLTAASGVPLYLLWKRSDGGPQRSEP